MILKASQRAGARELALHLLNGDTNEHVTVHEIRGFVSLDLEGALEEAQALSRGTRCTQYLFSLSLNPPDYADVPVEDFETAIDKIEKELKLTGQPRAIVFHEKNGRRHCHCVWSRIHYDEKLKAINMAHFKTKLSVIAKALYQEHGWELPRGFKKDTETEADNYRRAEWQQAERLKEDPAALKEFFQTAWAQSDNTKAFAAALQEYGYFLARGDRRGYVAVDYQGETYSLSRWLGVKTNALKEKLGDKAALPSADQARSYAESRMDENLKTHLAARRAAAKEKRAPMAQELRQLIKQQRHERERLLTRQSARWDQETRARIKRFPRGLTAVWDRVTGRYKQICAQNTEDTAACQKRDRDEQHQLIQRHLAESQKLHESLNFYKREQQAEEWRIKQQMAGYINTATQPDTPAPPISRIQEQIIVLEQKIVTLSDNIEDLQSALDNALLSEEAQVRIRVLIERAKEALFSKKAKEKSYFEHRKRAKAEELEQAQQQFYRHLQRHEKLKQEFEQQKRQIAHNREFYARIQNMAYTLNGLPLHRITITAPEGPPFNEVKYQQNLRRQSTASLIKAVTTPPPKQPITTTGLRENVLTVKEALNRTSGGSKQSFKPKNIHYNFPT
jgi:methionine salvage enolase-phosphatase E1